MSPIRFRTMDMKELLTVVRDSAVLNPESLLDLVYEKYTGKHFRCRAIIKVGENVASEKFGAKVISPRNDNPEELLNGNSSLYNHSTGYTSHDIADDHGIVVALENNYVINKLRILLWDRDDRLYSYYVEVSVNQIDWERVEDYSDHFCRSLQNLYFPSRSVRYIKLVGTRVTKNLTFRAVALEAFNVRDVPSLVNGFVSPTWNVATLSEGATVIEGNAFEGDELNVILNGGAQNYNCSTGFTYHDLSGDASIIVQLSQPFNIDSIRILLWDWFKDRVYSFYIETSTDKENWQMAVDKRNKKLRSWQQFSFQSRLVVFIKIVGTYNSEPDNDLFHLVHFEARCSQEMI